jgi:NADP-dependent 3-hydroxy acid dehydrogenase YdfG
MTGQLAGRLAVVTGAGSGIGKAIAVALSRERVELCVVGKDSVAMAETVEMAQQFSKVTSFEADITIETSLKPLLQHVQSAGKLDILVHSAGLILQNPMEHARIEDLDLQYATNLRAPYVITQQLLPSLTTACGQIVFINSSVGLEAKRPEIGQYSATKHALKAIADSLREEVNPKGIRVVTVFLGRVATPMQEALHSHEKRDYHPERLLQPEDVASVVVYTLGLPPTAEVTDIHIRPMMRT